MKSICKKKLKANSKKLCRRSKSTFTTPPNQKMAALKNEALQDTHPFALPKSSSNRALKPSNAESKLSPYTCPLSILNASHSRMNCSRSLTRAMDSSGSLEPRARARYEATMVDSPPMYVNQTHICGFPLFTRKNEIKQTQDRSRNRRLSAYMRSKSVQRLL